MHKSEEVSADCRLKDDARKAWDRERLLRGHSNINSRPRVGKRGQVMQKRSRCEREKLTVDNSNSVLA